MTPNPDAYPDNSVRAAWAAAGLTAYGRLTGQDDPSHLTDPDGLREIAGDYISDLLHLLADHRVNIPALLEKSRTYFLEERPADQVPGAPDLRSLLATIRATLDHPTGTAEQRLDLIAECTDRYRWNQDSDPWLTGGTEPARESDAVWNDIIARLAES